jgi:putative sigma-54 modulation protein
MQILVTFKNVDSSEYLKTYLEEKLERLRKNHAPSRNR